MKFTKNANEQCCNGIWFHVALREAIPAVSFVTDLAGVHAARSDRGLGNASNGHRPSIATSYSAAGLLGDVESHGVGWRMSLGDEKTGILACKATS